jgi:ABC-type transport system substrate-binding protein
MEYTMSGITRGVTLVRLIVFALGVAALLAVACTSDAEPEPAAPAATAAPAAPAATMAPSTSAAPQAAAPAAAAATAMPAPTQPAAMMMEPEGELLIGVPLLHPLVQLQEKDANGTVGGPGTDFQIFEGIFRAQFTEPGVVPNQEEYEPEIAESWTIASDMNSATMNIRRGIMWHNDWGELKAEDVVFTFNNSFKPGSVSNAGEQLTPGHRAGWEVIDEFTAKMNVIPGEFSPTWGVWHGGLGWDSTFGITCKHCFEEMGEGDFITTPIGTGPFKATRWVGNDEVVGEALTDHWRIVPNIKTLKIFEMPEDATREAAIRTGEVDITKISVKKIAGIVDDTNGIAVPMGLPNPNTIYFSGNYWAKVCPECEDPDLVANPRPGFLPDSDHPWIGDPFAEGCDYDALFSKIPPPAGSVCPEMEGPRKVRWAMSMAIDRQGIVDNVMDGFSDVAYTAQHTQFPPGDENFQDEWIVPFDPGMAREYLAEAGYPDGFPVVFWATESVPNTWDPEVADAVAEMWREHLNLDVTVDKSPYASRRPETVTKEMDVPWLHGWGVPPGGTKAPFFCPTPGHLGGAELPAVACDVGYKNDVEPSLEKRIENSIYFQNYMSYWHINAAVATVKSFWVKLPTIVEWHPYWGGNFNNPATVVIDK